MLNVQNASALSTPMEIISALLETGALYAFIQCLELGGYKRKYWPFGLFVYFLLLSWIQIQAFIPYLDVVVYYGCTVIAMFLLLQLPKFSILYYAMIFYFCADICRSLISTPILEALGFPLTDIFMQSINYRWIAFLLQGAAKYFLAVPVGLFLKSPLKTRSPRQVLFILLPVFIFTYVHGIIFKYGYYGYHSENALGQDMALLSILLCLTALVTVMLTQKYFDNFQLQLASERQERLIQQQYAFYQSRKEADETLRHLHHDIHNHLLYLKHIAKDHEKAQQYLNDIEDAIALARVVPNTGNETVDVLLGEKLALAQREDIPISAYVDFSAANFLTPVELCTIWGNSLDNALEAAQQASDNEERFVRIKGGQSGPGLFINIVNTCSHEPVREGDTYLTHKLDSTLHGQGLASLRRVVGTRQGTVHTEYSEGLFTLSIFIPFPVN